MATKECLNCKSLGWGRGEETPRRKETQWEEPLGVSGATRGGPYKRGTRRAEPPREKSEEAVPSGGASEEVDGGGGSYRG